MGKDKLVIEIYARQSDKFQMIGNEILDQIINKKLSKNQVRDLSVGHGSGLCTRDAVFVQRLQHVIVNKGNGADRDPRGYDA